MAGSFFTTEPPGKLIILTCTFLRIVEKHHRQDASPSITTEWGQGVNVSIWDCGLKKKKGEATTKLGKESYFYILAKFS